VKQDRLFVGVLTTQSNIDNLATAFNKTAAHHVNKIKFFIHADNVKTNFKLKNIVGFTDTRENYRIFHVIKYIADNYIEDYDFFFLIEDAAYLNGKKLLMKLNHISMSFDVYLGTKVEDRDEGYCDLRAGIVFSSSVIRKIKTKLDNCVRSADGTHHSINIGRCVQLATDIRECQETFQGITLNSYQLINNQKIYRDLYRLKDEPDFNDALSIFPITNSDDIFILHAYFSKLHLENVKKKILKLEKEASSIGDGAISNNILEVRWPLGVPDSMKPQYRHDIILWTHLNLTHSFMGEDSSNVKLLSKIDAIDIHKILEGVKAEVKKMYPQLIFREMQSAYRRFDHVRGMEYRVQLIFEDNHSSNAIVQKSFEVVKPISLIQIIPSPYVTESTRIAIIVPVFSYRVDETIEFIARYEEICLLNKDSTTLVSIRKKKKKIYNKLFFLRCWYFFTTLTIQIKEKWMSFID
jgi:chondroitin polymerizing factor